VANWRTMQDKDYLGAYDLVGPNGQPRDFTLTISVVESKALKTRQQPNGKRKVTIAFEGARKRMVSNSTNCETIEGMYGADTDAWIGKKVTLYPTVTDFGKKRNIPCIRIRPAIPKGSAEAVPDREVDEAVREQQTEAAREAGED
jgi:hypothetical protein